MLNACISFRIDRFKELGGVVGLCGDRQWRVPTEPVEERTYIRDATPKAAHCHHKCRESAGHIHTVVSAETLPKDGVPQDQGEMEWRQRQETQANSGAFVGGGQKSDCTSLDGPGVLQGDCNPTCCKLCTARHCLMGGSRAKRRIGPCCPLWVQPNTRQGSNSDGGQASFVRGVGVFWTRPTHPTLDPPTRLLTHPGPPPPLINLWGAFFVNQIEAKALSRGRQPQRVTPQNLYITRIGTRDHWDCSQVP